MCVCVCVCVFWQHFFVNTTFIKHNRHFMSTYFLLDPFEFPYYFYCIRGEIDFCIVHSCMYLLSIKKKHTCPTTQLRKILTDNTTILELQNNKQKLQILEHYILETCNRHLTELIFKPVLMYLNVFSY